ncbi:MAG: outer membrane protein transport protein, partial [Deltaproteobacteria bacterium]|nr:outer membrane protein transport protein [Deltaproteobacteria bacterium]
ALLLLVAATPAAAGGLGRPNGISARGVGMGGAWTAWVDDPTAVVFNPAALSEIETQASVGAELVIGPRSYVPLADDGTRGPAQETTIVAPVPSLGVVGRFASEDQPSRVTFGAGAWNTFGGKVRFPKTGASALDATEDLVIETSVAAALRVSDRLSVGGAVRLGIGLFSIEATEKPFDATLSASGVGVAVALGVLFRPTETVRVAMAWRSPLRITTSGAGTIELPGGSAQSSVEHLQTWPQQASLGVGLLANPRLKLAGQLDWTAWSELRELVVAATGTPTQTYREDWQDTWTARLGVAYTATPTVTLRGGTYVDSNAVPDRTIERQYLDSTKVGVSMGASVTRGAWRVDAAVDVVLAPTREVPNNSAETVDFPADRNIAPGSYAGTLLTFELAIAYRF